MSSCLVTVGNHLTRLYLAGRGLSRGNCKRVNGALEGQERLPRRISSSSFQATLPRSYHSHTLDQLPLEHIPTKPNLFQPTHTMDSVKNAANCKQLSSTSLPSAC